MSSYPTRRRAAKRQRLSNPRRPIQRPVFRTASGPDQVPSLTGWSISKLNTPGRAGPEWKYKDSVQTVPPTVGVPTVPVTALSTGVFVCLNGLAPGSGPSQRIGTIIHMQTIEYKLTFTSSAAAPNTASGQLRSILFYDKQANANTPSIGPSDLLETNNYIVSPRGMNQRRRYKILSDKTFPYAPLTSGGFPSVNFSHFIRFRRPLMVQYNGGVAGDQNDIVTNALWLLIVSSTSSATSVNYFFHVRVRYTD